MIERILNQKEAVGVDFPYLHQVAWQPQFGQMERYHASSVDLQEDGHCHLGKTEKCHGALLL
jgi:hypothetical protein